MREVIESDGVVRNGLSRKLINERALARWIQASTNEPHSFDAILGAIRRYPIKERVAAYQKTGKFIRNVIMKDKIVHVSVRNGPDIPSALAKFSGKVDYDRGDTFHLTAGVDTVSVLIDSKNLSALLTALPKKSVLKVIENLAEITILMSEEATKAKGTLAAISSQLTMNDININDLVKCPPHTIIVFEESDALNAYRAIQGLRGQQ